MIIMGYYYTHPNMFKSEYKYWYNKEVKNSSLSWKKYHDDDGLTHRDDGPAVISKYRCMWQKHGKLHREDGPAVIQSDGIVRWYYEGRDVFPNNEFGIQRAKANLPMREMQMYDEDDNDLWDDDSVVGTICGEDILDDLELDIEDISMYTNANPITVSTLLQFY
jgi:hypothetical protein